MSMIFLGMFGLYIPWIIPSLIWSALMILSEGTPYFAAWAYWLLSSDMMHSIRQGRSLSSAAAFLWSSSMFSSSQLNHSSASIANAESSVKQSEVIVFHAFDLLMRKLNVLEGTVTEENSALCS